jgi:hypothetical protein
MIASDDGWLLQTGHRLETVGLELSVGTKRDTT